MTVGSRAKLVWNTDEISIQSYEIEGSRHTTTSSGYYLEDDGPAFKVVNTFTSSTRVENYYEIEGLDVGFTEWTIHYTTLKANPKNLASEANVQHTKKIEVIVNKAGSTSTSRPSISQEELDKLNEARARAGMEPQTAGEEENTETSSQTGSQSSASTSTQSIASERIKETTPTQTPNITSTPAPTKTPVPTQTPKATQTQAPTKTPVPTQTQIPTQAPVVTQTPEPTVEPEVFGNVDPIETTETELPFIDVYKENEFYDAIQYVYTKEIFKGMEEDYFGQEDPMTRGMIVTVLYRIDGADEKEYATFSDVPSTMYYSKPIAWANKKGIVLGVGDNKYEPDKPLTRQDLATIISRYMLYKGIGIKNTDENALLSDINEVADYAINPVKLMVQKGIMMTNDYACFEPTRPGTRAEIAYAMMILDKAK